MRLRLTISSSVTRGMNIIVARAGLTPFAPRAAEYIYTDNVLLRSLTK